MLLSKSVEIRQSETASRPAIRRSRICIFTQPRWKAVIRYLSYYADGGASPRAKTTEYDTDEKIDWTSKCAECPLKTQCTTGKERRIKRWEHEAVIDAMHRSDKQTLNP